MWRRGGWLRWSGVYPVRAVRPQQGFSHFHPFVYCVPVLTGGASGSIGVSRRAKRIPPVWLCPLLQRGPSIPFALLWPSRWLSSVHLFPCPCLSAPLPCPSVPVPCPPSHLPALGFLHPSLIPFLLSACRLVLLPRELVHFPAHPLSLPFLRPLCFPRSGSPPRRAMFDFGFVALSMMVTRPNTCFCAIDQVACGLRNPV